MLKSFAIFEFFKNILQKPSIFYYTYRP